MQTPEITWSIMHPTPLDVAYMRRLVAELPRWRCDSFEICAECHSLLGGMDGLVLYEDYPAVAASLDRAGILANRARLQEILDLAHGAGRPVYYWHREVTVWPKILQETPELLDANGEFDLLGAAYGNLLRYKLEKTFEAVPNLDGLVLTLTEADFSAIHNSSPDRYPPARVVERIVRIFAEEHVKRGKRFILRSFGSIAQDYEDILAGARLAASGFSFEVETKITPYDFDPFLPDNPFLRPVAPGITLGAECDCEGEFLGFGHLPAENVEHIVRFVRHGQRQGVSRYTIRLDRMGCNVFDSYPINLFAYQRAILDPDATAEGIRAEYAAAHYPPECADELTALGDLGFRLVEKLLFIDHVVMFHQNPVDADLKWMKAGGLFVLFAPEGTPLAPHQGIWPMLPQTTVGIPAILAEKREALAIARDGFARVEALKGRLDAAEYQRLSRLWGSALREAVAIQAFVSAIAAYFGDMAEDAPDAPRLHRAIQEMADALHLPPPERTQGKTAFHNGMDHHIFALRDGDFCDRFDHSILGAACLLLDEYDAETAARAELRRRLPDALDFVVAGGLFQDWRFRRNMHASHAALLGGRPARLVGNPVFPNGFVRVALASHNGTPATRLFIAGEGACQVSVDGGPPQALALTADGVLLPLAVATAESIELVFTKAPGPDYPALRAIALLP